MAQVKYEGPEQFAPLSAWQYFGYSLLFAVPLVGFICLVVFSFNDSNINRRNYARSFFCSVIFVVAVIAAIYFLLLSLGLVTKAGSLLGSLI